MKVLFGTENPTDGKEHDRYYAWLKTGNEMKKRHYSKSRRIMEIILEAKKGHAFYRGGSLGK